MIKKHYVTFYSPGTFFTESSRKEIESWETKKAVEMSKDILERYNAKPHSFQFSTIITAEPVKEEGIELQVEEKEVKRSGVYFLGGRLRFYDEVLKENNEDEDILRSNMECNGMWIVIENTNSYRFTGEFDEDAFIVNDEGSIVRSGKDEDLVAYRKKKNDERESL
jgi:hypothetical protein